MVDISSAIRFHTINHEGNPVSFSLQEAVNVVQHSAQRPLSQEEIDALNIWLTISDTEPVLFYPRVAKWRA